MRMGGTFYSQPTTSSSSSHQSLWHSPVPYLFGGLAAMLFLIAFALTVLSCSYWRYNDEEDNNNNNNGEEESIKVVVGQAFEEMVVVIMAGDQQPSFLATPILIPKSNFSCSCGDEESCILNEIEMAVKEVVVAAPAAAHHNYN